ncbi:phosphatidylinositol kinase- protein kinase tor1, partial [Coemansia sp. RSA 989]
RSQAAKDVLAKLHDVYPELVEETEVVSRELIRITFLFPELWINAIIYVNGVYESKDGYNDIIRTITPIYKLLFKPETLREYHFVQKFGKALTKAYDMLTQYFTSKNDQKLKLAIDQYRYIYHCIREQYPRLSELNLMDTSPILAAYSDMALVVPGTYNPDRELGQDDLRQDERAMQLFGLINSLLMKDDETAKRFLAIEQFPVVPLSSNSGLIGFYPDCESFHSHVNNIRKVSNQPINLEQRLACQFSPNWDTLTVMQKVESFEYALSNTPGNDLQRAMWYTAPNAEVWLERRTNYTRSLA